MKGECALTGLRSPWTSIATRRFGIDRVGRLRGSRSRKPAAWDPSGAPTPFVTWAKSHGVGTAHIPRLEGRLPMLAHLVSLATLLALPTAADPPREGSPPAAAVDLKPVTVAVVDRDSGAPVRSFTYQAWYDAPGRKSPQNGDEWTQVVSSAGTFEIQTPPACRLSVMAKAADYIGGYPLLNEFVIKSADNPRRVVVRLRRGITVRGSVRDSRTKAPIAGATVRLNAISRSCRTRFTRRPRLMATEHGVERALDDQRGHPRMERRGVIRNRKRVCQSDQVNLGKAARDVCMLCRILAHAEPQGRDEHAARGAEVVAADHHQIGPRFERQ
jgi:hypothetical protein